MSNDTDEIWVQSGWATYGAIMLFGGGLVGVVNGIWALRYDRVDLELVLLEQNLDLWGTYALLGGVVMLTAAIGVFYGKDWARWTGIVVSVLGLVWNVGWAEVQPTQSLIGAVISISVVFALAMNPVTVRTGS